MRLGHFLNHLVSKRALLIIGALLALLVAIGLDNAWSTAAYVAAASALAALLFVMSMRMSDLYSGLRRLDVSTR